jgi:hypothetical protein
MMAQGLVEIDDNPPFKEAGQLFTRQIQNSLDNIGDMEEVTAATTITAESLSDYQENVGSMALGKALSTTEYENIFTRGTTDSSLIELAKQMGTYIGQQLQRYINYAITGAFDTALASTHYIDVSAGGADQVGDGLMSYDAMVEAAALLGEEQEEFDVLIINSKINRDMKRKAMAIDQLPVENFKGQVLSSGVIPVIDGKRIIINDTICAESDGKYPCFLMAGKPLYLGYIKQPTVYEDFVILTGGGTHRRAWYTYFGTSVKGVSYGGALPTTAVTLAAGASWTKKAATKNIKIVKFLVSGAQ